MNTIKPLLLLSLLAVTAQAQLVTNTNVDLVWSQETEDALRLAWKIDENQRVNGIAPYTTTNAPIPYKEFLGTVIAVKAAEATSRITAQKESLFIKRFQELKVADPAKYDRLYRIAFGKGAQ